MMTEQPTPARVPDLHKSAFWIYGVTAMVMREPLSIVLHHAGTAGWADRDVQVEALRGLVVWITMSRQFTVAGIHFDRVYLQPDSATRFLRRSFPVDFLLGIGALLLSVGASTVVATTGVGATGRLFDSVVGAILLWDLVWLAAARVMGHSSVSLIAPGAFVNVGILEVFGSALLLLGPLPGYCTLLVCLMIQLALLMAAYDKLYAVSGGKS